MTFQKQWSTVQQNPRIFSILLDVAIVIYVIVLIVSCTVTVLRLSDDTELKIVFIFDDYIIVVRDASII